MESRENRSGLALSCESCGAPLHFDIIRQNDGCLYCGTELDLEMYLNRQESVGIRPILMRFINRIVRTVALRFILQRILRAARVHFVGMQS